MYIYIQYWKEMTHLSLAPLLFHEGEKIIKAYRNRFSASRLHFSLSLMIVISISVDTGRRNNLQRCSNFSYQQTTEHKRAPKRNEGEKRICK